MALPLPCGKGLFSPKMTGFCYHLNVLCSYYIPTLNSRLIIVWGRAISYLVQIPPSCHLTVKQLNISLCWDGCKLLQCVQRCMPVDTRSEASSFVREAILENFRPGQGRRHIGNSPRRLWTVQVEVKRATIVNRTSLCTGILHCLSSFSTPDKQKIHYAVRWK